MRGIVILGSDRLASGHFLAAERLGGLSIAGRLLRVLGRWGATELVIIGPEAFPDRDMLCRDPKLSVPVRWVACELEQAAAIKVAAEHVSGPSTILTADQLVSPDVLVQGDDLGVDGVQLLCGALAAERKIPILGPDFPARIGDALCPYTLTASAGKSCSVTRGVWEAVRRRSDFPSALYQLSRSLRKPLSREADGLVAYFINRPISLQISRCIVNSFITPNQITAIGLIVGILAAILVAGGDWFWMTAGGLLLQIASVLDGVDGEIARMRLSPSHSGEWFDTVADDVTNVSFLVGLGFAAGTTANEPLYRWMGIVCAGLMVVTLGLFYRDFIRLKIASHNHFKWGFESEQSKKQPGLAVRVATVFSWIAKRDFYTLLLMLLLFGKQPVAAFYIMFVGSSFIVVGSAIQRTMNWTRGRTRRK